MGDVQFSYPPSFFKEISKNVMRKAPNSGPSSDQFASTARIHGESKWNHNQNQRRLGGLQYEVQVKSSREIKDYAKIVIEPILPGM